MSIRFALACILFFASACSTIDTPASAAQLNGRWQGDNVTLIIDVNAKTYTGVYNGKPFQHRIDSIEDRTDFFVLTIDGDAIRADLEQTGLVLIGVPQDKGVFVLRRDTKSP
jgi:hypothetical protein